MSRARLQIMTALSLVTLMWFFPVLGACADGSTCGATGAPDSENARAPAEVESVVVAQIPALEPVRTSTGPDLSLAVIPPGARIVRLDRTEGGWRETNLTRDFAAAADPSLSFDGRRIVFAGQRRIQDDAAVFEMSADGRDVRLIHQPEGGCDQPVYLSTLYRLDAPAPVEQIAFRSAGRGGQRSAISRCDLAGGEPHQITFVPGGVSDPLLLSDGRLLFSMALDTPEERNAGVGTASPVGLATIHTDGTDVFPFVVPGRGVALRAHCETTDGRIVFSEHASDSAPRWLYAPRARPWMVESLAGDERVPRKWLSGSSSPQDQTLLVATRTDARDTFGIRMIRADCGQDAGALYDDPGWHDVRALVIVPRPKPPGRSTVVTESVTSGQLYCLNAKVSEDGATGMPRKPRIAAVRLYAWQTDSAITGTAASAWPKSPHARPRRGEIILGEAGVETDGSFFLELPSGVPFRLETIDDRGETLRAMNSYAWVMPMERRGCIGCHEDRRTAPPNRHVLALRRPPHQLGPPRDRHMRSIEQHDDRDVP